ncbi:M13 family metallopeptidase [Hymenobacter sp. BT186]|uniref:M13 family metallopeptidase n=1 Tax=Hymenobacter telluris TaxID=2816474 RepID=A0A939EXB2_9BACT|nr:M13 family metallopeptidase [Hymenobacter telluris]MBO0358312.1 M13 family metallopeptidase [Hymenobacter telluris]MBW3374338.1 M13 family metallopeptidase [Hymenobacter norwichensis]
MNFLFSRRWLLAAPAVALALGGCQSGGKSGAGQPDLLQANLDTTVRPGDDFFQYANGAWLKKHPIPTSESSWSIGKEVQDEVYARLLALNKEAASANAAAGSTQQKIGDFWATGMDSVAVDKQGLAPLKPELDRLAALRTPADVQAAIARLLPLNVNALLGVEIDQDAKNSEKMALYLYQAGLGLPNRDYYFNKDKRTTNIRNEYGGHITKMLTLLGEDAATAQRHSAQVVKLETALAGSSRKLEDLRDPYANYNKMAVADLSKLTPGLDWKAWLTQLDLGKVDTVIVGQPEFYREAGRLLRTTPVEDWRAYLQWQLLHTYAERLSTPFDNENFRFYGTVLQGRKEQRARWKRVLDDEENAMGEALGQLFVKEYFAPETKARYAKLTENVVAAFREHIQALTWMSDSTKQKALVKLTRITPKVGYPDNWKDYSALDIKRDSYAANMMRANQWNYRFNLNKLGKPVDRTEWGMSPQTYNAYYNPSNNEIVLPAAIFAIPGLKDADADDAIIYGYAGASTIGHELTHGFDDEGSQFDEKGNLRNWWSKKDRAAFQQRVNGIVRQFNGYTVLDSLHINGKATAGENIADLGGIVIAFDAFKKTEQYKKGEKIGGITPTQRYFLGYALGWQSHQRDETLAQRILTDVHSPASYRVNGPFADVPAFYEAFNVKPTDKLYRPDSARVTIW